MSINFNDLHDKMIQKINGLVSKEDFYQWLDENIEVETYIPITKKYALINVFSNRFNTEIYSDDGEISEIFNLIYDLESMFVFLFGYTDVFVRPKDRTVDNYDLIIKSGFFDYIMSFCKNDYLDLQKKCDRVCSIDNLILLNGLIKSLSQPSVEDMEKIKNIINNEIDKDKLDVLKAIEEYNNPFLKKVIDSVSKKEAAEIMKNNNRKSSSNTSKSKTKRVISNKEK